MKRWLGLATAIAGLGVAGVHLAQSDNGGFKSKLAGSTPLVTIRGVPAGGLPWATNEESQVRLRPNGDLDADIRGLLLAAGVGAAGNTTPPNLVGTTPINTVRIAVTWAVPDPAAPVLIEETGPVPLDADGNASVHAHIAPPPAGADRPIVLVRIGATPLAGAFIALSDLTRLGGAHRGGDD